MPEKEDAEAIRAEDSEFLRIINEQTDQAFNLFDCSEENGQFKFDYKYWGVQGFVLLRFLPYGLARWTKKNARETITRLLDSTFGISTSHELVDDEFVEDIARMLTLGLLQGVYGKARSLLVELDEEMIVWLRGVLASWMSDLVEGVNHPDINKDIEQLVKKLVSERKQFLKASIAKFNDSPQKEKLLPHYVELLPVWQDARSTFRSIKHRSAWQEMIATGFRDAALPPDLIALLSGNIADLQNLPLELREVAEKATEGGEDYSKPSNLALEHAARLSGYKSFQHGPRYLRKHMNEKSGVKLPEIDDTNFEEKGVI